MHIPTNTQTVKRPAPFPTFKKNSERVIKYAQDLWKARKELNETKKLLSTTALRPTDYPDEAAYDAAMAERLNINSAFVNIEKKEVAVSSDTKISISDLGALLDDHGYTVVE